MISMNSSVLVTSKQSSSELDGEAVILNLKSGMYYGLNAVGVTIWNLLQEPRIVSEIYSNLLAKYEVEPSQCERELLALLQQLEAQGLIEVKNEAIA